MFANAQVVQFPDSASFLEKATADLLDPEYFIGSGRFFAVPLLYKGVIALFGESPARLTDLQFGLSVFAWLSLATVSPERTAFWQSHGMPVNDRLRSMSGAFASGQDWAFCRAPERAEFRRRLQSSGAETYAQDLHAPLRTIVEPVRDIPAFVCPVLKIYRPSGLEELRNIRWREKAPFATALSHDVPALNRSTDISVELSVVVLALDQGHILPTLLPELRSTLEGLGASFEILLITERLDDLTRQACPAGGGEIHEPSEPGYGGALRTALAHARGDDMLTMDVDISDPSQFIRDMWNSRHGAELTIASLLDAAARRSAEAWGESVMCLSGTISSTDMDGRKRRVMVGTVLAIGVVVLLAWHAVDNSVSAEDRKYIPRYLVGIRAMPPEATRSYEDEINFVVRVQRAVLDVAPRNEGLPFGAEREPRDLFEARTGLCFDRSRVIEKILRYASLEARHVALYSTRETGSAMKSLLAPGVSSHAVTEVLTKKGWLVVDSNDPWVSLDATTSPVSIWRIKASADRRVRLVWSKPPNEIYEQPFTFVYGLYSRHGKLYPPYDFIPDINYTELAQNVRLPLPR